MRHSFPAPRQWLVVLCSTAALLVSAGALADPPSRVARLTQIEGAISFSPAGEEDWAVADANRPVTTGDRVWSDANSHVELQIGDASTRLGANTALTVLNLDDRIGQFQLAQGSLNVRVRQISGDQFYEVDTPTLAFSIRRAGDYRVDVDQDGNTTIVQVRAGSGEVWGEGTAYTVDAGQQYTFIGDGIRDVRYAAIPPADAFDQWCFDRNRREDTATSARYVSPQMVGYSDLDEYGTWRNVESYGTVWVPTRVQADWVPYHYGRWAWVEPWGWTWVDDQPWGFAPFHYGRWAYLSSRWCWVPGPVVARPVYAPALVAFVGGGGFSIAVGGGPVTGVAWFPLGYGEVYRPAYGVSRTYFTNINVTNTVINTTYVTNVYNSPNTEIKYRYREVPTAVTAVPVNAFASGERVDRHAVRVQSDVVARAEVTPVPRITPTRAAILATAAAAGTAAAVASHRPPDRVMNRQVVARTEPPAPKPSFAARERLLAEQPGRPPEPEKMRSVRAERPAEAPKVKMVAPNVQPRPVEAAKGGPQGGPTAQDERAMKDRRGRPEAAGPQANAPQPPASAQERMRGGPQAGAQGPTAQEERGMKDRRGRPEAAGPQANAPQPPASAQERMRAGPQGGPQGPTAQEDRGMKDRRGRPEAAGPQANAPQPPASPQERMRGGPQGGPQANAPQPPTAAQDRMKGGQAAQERAQQEQERAQQQGRAQQERAQQQGRAQQERSQQERDQQERTRQQQERAQQERSQADRAQQQAQQQRAQQERAQQQQAQQQRTQQERAQQQQAQQQRAQQERAQQQQAQQQRTQQERAQQQQAQQQRAQQERAQQQAAQQQQRAQQQAEQQRAQQQSQQQRAPQEQRREEPKARGQAQEKDKDKEPRG